MTEKDIIKLYQEDMLSINAIAKIPNIGYSYRGIQKILAQNNVPIRGGRKKKTLTEEQMKDLQFRLCEKSENISDLAKIYNLDKETLRNIINEQGWMKKTTNRVNKNIKSNYFSKIDSPTKAYWLGVLFTDGSVDKQPNKKGRIRLQLQAKDKELVEKLKNDLNVDSNLIFDHRGNGCYSLEFVDDQIFSDLAKYNIIPNKTYTIKNLPINIPKEYLKDYARGLLDGDGGIVLSQDLSSDVSINFTSYSESLVKDFQLLIDELIEKENHNKLIYTSCWHCQWRGYNQVVKILDILYKDSERYLLRKYNKYIALLNRDLKN